MSILAIATVALCMAQTPQAPQTKTYANYEFGLSFEYPASWLSTTKKGDTKFTIVLESGAKATVDIHSVTFNADTEIWRYVQKDIVLQMKRQVIEQQEEEILGVPLLTTRSKYTENGTATVSLSGLIYAATPRKLLFRLTAPESVFGDAEAQWREVLQSIRTTSGQPLKREDPNRKIDPKELKNVSSKPIKVTRIDNGNKQKETIAKGEVAVSTTVSSRNVVLRLPAGWQGEVSGDGQITIRNTDLSEPIVVSLYCLLDSDPPAKNLFRASSKSLDLFTEVKKREEPSPAKNKGGATVQTVWRWGKSSSGDLATCEATGLLGDFYWMIVYKSESASAAASDKKAIDALISVMSVELGS